MSHLASSTTPLRTSRSSAHTGRLALAQIFAVCLFLTPLLYSNDQDEYKVLKIMAVAMISVCAIVYTRSRIRSWTMPSIAFAYAAVLILQSIAVVTADLRFNIQYAAVFAAAIIPSIAIEALPVKKKVLEQVIGIAFATLSLIILANIFGGRILGFGESFEGLQGGRNFGFLGDSITPVIILPLLYFLLRRNLIGAALMILCLILTGGKAGGLMLIAALFLIPLFVLRGPLRYFLLGLGAAGIYFLYPYVAELLESDKLQYSWNTRQLSYEIGIRLFTESPIWGVGVNQSMEGMSARAELDAHLRGLTRYWVVGQIHNSFVRSMAETGLIGLSVLIVFCAIIIRRALAAGELAVRTAQSPAQALALAGALWVIAFIVCNQGVGWFEHVHPQFAWLLMISSASLKAAEFSTHASRWVR